MSLFSFTFLLFLFIVFSLYWAKRDITWQNSVLLVASVIFIGYANIYFAIVILAYAFYIHFSHKLVGFLSARRAFTKLYKQRLVVQELYRKQVNQYCLQNPDIVRQLGTRIRPESIVESLKLIPNSNPNKKALVQNLKQIGLIQANRFRPETMYSSQNYQLQLIRTLNTQYDTFLLLTSQPLDENLILFLNNQLTFCDKLAKDFGIDWNEIVRQCNDFVSGHGSEAQANQASAVHQQLQAGTRALEAEVGGPTTQAPAKHYIVGDWSEAFKRYHDHDYIYITPGNLQKDKAQQQLLNFKMTSALLANWLIAAGLLPLIYFKYATVIGESLNYVFDSFGMSTDAFGFLLQVLPVLGISYFTFNALSLLASAYWGKIKNQELLITLTFVTYFPTLVAGPIMRATYLIPKLLGPRKFGNINEILFLATIGLTKKWLLATMLAENFVNQVFGAPSNYNSIEIIVAVYSYAFQLYLDFSGYTDLTAAIGLCLGIKHYRNFNAPYLAVNIKDFWTRWHISLSNWIRDFIYIPLGGNRNGWWKAQLYTLIAMVASGIWHGTTTNFVIWGFLHAFGVIFLNLLHRYKRPPRHYSLMHTLVSRWLTFNFVCFTWVFFNAQDFETAIDLLTSVVTNVFHKFDNPNAILLLLVFWGFVYPTLPYWHKYTQLLLHKTMRTKTRIVLPTVILLGSLIITLAPEGVPPFIYADF